MAISAVHGSLDLFRLMVREALRRRPEPPFCRVAEFGNQRLLRNIRTTGKILCHTLGIEHDSFDSNGKDGAIVQDLCQPMPGECVNAYDFVTNFGTSEHCSPSQMTVFENAHNICKPGGWMLHNVPGTGGCYGHGYFKYSVEFFKTLAAANGYITRQIDVIILGDGHKGQPGDYYVSAVLEKTKSTPFNRLKWEGPAIG